MAAKYYIYRNLHTGTWSVKYKGKVIAHPERILAYDAKFSVSKAGRAKVLHHKKKFVHAYVVATSWRELSEDMKIPFPEEAYYNPYKTETFISSKTGKALTAERSMVLLQDNKVWI